MKKIQIPNPKKLIIGDFWKCFLFRSSVTPILDMFSKMVQNQQENVFV